MCVVTFDYNGWTVRYPEFIGVSQAQALGYFNEATLYLDNTDCSVVCDCGQRSVLLNMLVAHIAQLYTGSTGQPATQLVGRVDQATEGSVSVGTDLQLPAGSAQWFAQTKYGLSFWQATARYRRFRYAPGRSRPQSVGPFALWSR